MDYRYIDFDIDRAQGLIYIYGIDDLTRLRLKSRFDLDQARNSIIRIQISGKLTRIPEWVFQFPNNEILDLSCNEICTMTAEDVEKIYELKHLRLLALSNNLLKVIPPEISQLDLLEELNVSSNNLTQLPSTLHNMDKIIKFSLQDWQAEEKWISNKFSTFPEVVLRMRNLRELEIARVGMAGFPDIPSELVGLEKLDVSWNPLDHFPEDFFPGERMKELNVSRTGFSKTPDYITRWKDLEVLRFTGTAIQALPDGIVDCKKLRVLDASGSRLRALPERIGECENLEEVYLTATPITTVPASLGRCTKLRTLDLLNSDIRGLPRELGDCPNLKDVRYSLWYAMPDDHPLKKEVKARVSEGL